MEEGNSKQSHAECTRTRTPPLEGGGGGGGVNGVLEDTMEGGLRVYFSPQPTPHRDPMCDIPPANPPLSSNMRQCNPCGTSTGAPLMVTRRCDPASLPAAPRNGVTGLQPGACSAHTVRVRCSESHSLVLHPQPMCVTDMDCGR